MRPSSHAMPRSQVLGIVLQMWPTRYPQLGRILLVFDQPSPALTNCNLNIPGTLLSRQERYKQRTISKTERYGARLGDRPAGMRRQSRLMAIHTSVIQFPSSADFQSAYKNCMFPG